MIVCSCNVFSDHDVRSAVTEAKDLPRTAGQVYGCLGCSAQCGRCARTIKKIMDEALGACAKSCCAGCPHSEMAEAKTHQAKAHTKTKTPAQPAQGTSGHARPKHARPAHIDHGAVPYFLNEALI